MSDWFRQDETLTSVAIDDRGFQYGDGLFETIAVRHGTPRLWELHVDRLAAGCERLGLETPDATGMRRSLDAAIAAASTDPAYCVAKIIVTGGVTQRGYGRPPAAPASLYFGVFPSAPQPEKAYREGVATMRCNTRLAVGSATAGLKTLNRIEQVLARSECLARDVFEGLTFDAEGRLICGTMSNVFLVRENDIVTPSLSRCGVRGVMRRHVVETLRATEQTVTTCDLGEDELLGADEVFLSNSQFGLLPVRTCGDATWPAGPVTREVMDLLANAGIDECRL